MPGLVGAGEEIDAFVRCLTVWDDGTGPALYVGGGFTMAGGVEANHIVRFDGRSWSALEGPDGAGVDNRVSAIHAHDAGDGEALYLAGAFSNPADGRLSAVGRFIDGQTQALQGTPEIFGRTLGVFDASDGPALYVGGDFRPIPDHQPGYIARWQPRPRCITDLTGDCVSDLRDFLEFQNLFAAGDDRADFDGDGALTIFDFLAFHNAFDAGCP